jgi:hypothetical protein
VRTGGRTAPVTGMPTYHFELTVAVLEEGVVVLQFGNVPAADLPKEPPFGNWAD